MVHIHTMDAGASHHIDRVAHRRRTAYLAFKRAFDIICSIGLLTALAFPMAVVVVLAAIDTKGNPFFVQARVGRHGRHFKLYKFRSMRADAPADVPTYMLENAGSYITKIGARLRKLSLDELPQLINILKGDMSFIGPRPVVPSETELVVLRARNRVDDIRPGLTGWAQVNGRDDVTLEEKAILDTEYVAQMGLWMDARIFVRTVIQVLRHKGVTEGANPQIAQSLQSARVKRTAS